MKVCFEYLKDGKSTFRQCNLDCFPNKDDFIVLDNTLYKVIYRRITITEAFNEYKCFIKEERYGV